MPALPPAPSQPSVGPHPSPPPRPTPAGRPPSASPAPGAARLGPTLCTLLADPDFRGEDPEGQDAETERFLSTSYTGRRVSFNEAALFEQSRKSQDKGRR